MAGITDGVPEVAVGEPMKLGDNGEYELEHEPITDRLIIRDTQNGTEAYVRPETQEQIGDRGIFLRSMANGEVLADDGRLYSDVISAEEAASGWLFIPPGDFPLSGSDFRIETSGLTVYGCGYASFIDGGGEDTVPLHITAPDVTVRGVRVRTNTDFSGDDAIIVDGPNANLTNLYVMESELNGINVVESDCRISHSYIGPVAEINNTSFAGVNCATRTTVFANFFEDVTTIAIRGQPDCTIGANYIKNAFSRGIYTNSPDSTITGNTIFNCGTGIEIDGGGGADNIVANNRIADCSTPIVDNGTNTLLDGNVTGASN